MIEQYMAEGIIIADSNGIEQGFLPSSISVDVDIVSTHDFQMIIPYKEWNDNKYGYGCRFFVPGKEYGGIIDDIESVTSTKEVNAKGLTWRGLMMKKIIEPPAGQSHLVLSGDLSDVIGTLIGNKFDGLIVASTQPTNITVTNWQVDRYTRLYSELSKLVEAYQCRLQIRYVELQGMESGFVEVEAVPIVDYSEELEYSQEGKVNVDIRDFRGGINHLICAGEGQNQERIVVHLYVDEKGCVSQEQTFFGIDERADVYSVL